MKTKLLLTLASMLLMVTGLRAQTPYAVLADGTLTFSYGTPPDGVYGLNEGFDTPDWNTVAASITTVVFDPSFADARPNSCYKWFDNCQSLTAIEGLNYLNTTEVTNMALMFNYCKKLSSLDLSTFNTAKVTEMQSIFF